VSFEACVECKNILMLNMIVIFEGYVYNLYIETLVD